MQRRTHRKSRNGCRNCKKRRIKCDELRPQCSNCSKYEDKCNFYDGSPEEHLPDQRPTAESNTNRSRPRGRGRPRKALNELAHSTHKDRETRDTPDSFEPPDPASYEHLPPLNVADLELLHYYITLTYKSLGVASFWRDSIVQLGRSFHFLTDLLLSLSAMHLVQIRPERREEYFLLAEQHFTRGLKDVIPLLSKCGLDTCQPLYVSGILICFYHFAKGPSPGDYLVFSNSGPAAWRSLLSGVRAILEGFEPAVLYSGLLAPLTAQHSEPCPAEPSSELSEPVQWEEPLTALRESTAMSTHAHADIYLRAWDNLWSCYKDAYGENGQLPERHKNRLALAWLYRMNDEFVFCLERHESTALILLAYFGALLKSMESCFFMVGWAEHLVKGMSNLVDEDDKKWLNWPIAQVGGYEVLNK